MSLKTDNFKLYKYEDNDIGDLRFINDSMDIIDKGINPFYVATKSSTNVYKVTTGLNKTSLANGYSIKVAVPSNSTGAVSITVDSVTVPVKKPNGNAVTNFKQNGVYSLTYYNSVFILASGGGADTVNFSASDLLTGKSANDSNGEKVNGTMPNKGTVTASLNCGGSYTIPKGYHNGSGKVTANSLASQTGANATAGDILTGKTAWINGSKINGTMPNRGEYQIAGGIGFGDDYVAFNKIPYGCYPQSSNGWAPEIRAKKTDVAAALGLTADKIVAGNTISGIAGSATIQSLGGKKFYNNIIDVTIPKNTATFNVNIGFAPTTVILRILTPTGDEANNWIFARSTDIPWLTHAWKDYQSSSSSSYTPTTQIDSLTNTGFVYRVQQSGGSYSTNKSYKFQIFAIG